MKVEPGQTVLQFRLTEKIGEGGMGQVWGAVDTTLDRRVAIKLLPDAFADTDRLARFEREAKLLASLRHPNIAVLHGLHELPATIAGQAGQRFLSMELVEGPDLAERVRSGPVAVGEAIRIAVQIARGLESAHARGIIHRDLKPANVKLDRDGTVKVLDFGLAKALAPDSSIGDADASDSPTVTAATKAGVILGTAGYMAPEQVRGMPVDRHVDIWAFGVVLFELFTGKQAFGGHTASDAMAKILEREPDWGALPRNVPAATRRLLKRCLMKDVTQRLQAIGDARIELEECVEQPAGPVGDEPVPAAPPWKRFLPYALLPVAILLGVVLRPTSTPDPAPTSRSELLLPHGLRLDHEDRNGLALSPDGRTVAFTAGGHVYLRSLDDWSARRLTEVEAYMPRFSPSGTWLAFTNDDGLFRVLSSGGNVKRVHESTPSGGMTWIDDESIVFAPDMTGGLLRVPAGGGDPKPISELDVDTFEVSHRLPHGLPGGRSLLYTAIRYREVPVSGGRPTVFALDLTTGQRTLLVENAFDARYAATGHIVFAREGRLFAAPFDLDPPRITGPEVVVVDGVVHSVHTPRELTDTGAAQFAISDSGVLAYASGSVFPQTWFRSRLVWVDRRGHAEPLEASEGEWYSVRVSPDGRKALLTSRAPPRNVWIYDVERKFKRRQTFQADQFYPVWGPGPDRFTVDSDRDGPAGIFTKVVDSGPGEVDKLDLPDGSMLLPGSWTSDGKRLVFHRASVGSEKVRNYVYSSEHGVAEVSAAAALAGWPQFSPDGRWIAYAALGAFSDLPQVFIQRYPESGRAIQISTREGDSPVWSRDGREVFFLGPDPDGGGDAMYVVRVDIEHDEPSPSDPAKLMDFPYQGCSPVRCFDIAPDGRFLALEALEGQRQDAHEAHHPDRIRLVHNWFTELDAKVPSDR